jgi:exo-beta-1,3-glucanase (GH17 family)
VDNLGPAAAGGGISGIALGIANRHERESGLEAVRGIEDGESDRFSGSPERGHTLAAANADGLQARNSYHSSTALGAAAAAAGQATPGQRTPNLLPSNPSQQSLGEQSPYGYYGGGGGLYDGPYQGYGSRGDPGSINPDEIADDGDDGFAPPPQRRSVLGLNKTPSHDALPAAAGGAAAGGLLGSIFNRHGNKAGAESGPSYGPVPGSGLNSSTAEKGAWASQHEASKKRKRWFLTLLVGFAIIAVIVGAIVGGIIGSRKDSGKGSNSADTGSASADEQSNGDLNKNSPEIQALMNNPNLHKVFPGMDYTPWGVQYPLCLQYPPSQNNVTRDLAVLSQLTNTVRLYGTDCNQTEMVLHAINKLELTGMKLWLGVWIDSNTTTNDRQIQQMYKVIDETNDTSIFQGAIVGNEALYRAGPDVQTAETNLVGYIESVRRNFTQRKLNIPVATSDLGDNWNADLVQASDLVMANVHPFFGGVPVDQAASWTWSFFQEHDVSLTKGTNKKSIISEVGWPSAGGNDCGSNVKCSNSQAGSVAGIDEMNQFLSDWVCQALSNGTEYFWYVRAFYSVIIELTDY